MKTRLINNLENENIDKEIINMKPNTKLLHPLTCAWMDTQDIKTDICLTKYIYNKKDTDYYDINTNNFNFYITNKCKNKNLKKYKNYLYIPPVGISSDIILKIYNIKSIDSLINWLEEKENNNINTINRVLNCYISNNINILKNHYTLFENIYKKLLIKYSNKKLVSKIVDLDKETHLFFKDWFNEIYKIFEINLWKNYNNYFEKKYN